MRFPRPEKLTITRGIAARLEERMKSGPPEPPLDAFVDECKTVIMNLEAHVDGGASADGARAALLAKSEESGDIVDTWVRKIAGFVEAEALRKTGPNRERAKKLYHAAFPQGLAIVKDRTTEENARCRASIEVLRAPENAETLAAIGLPSSWIDALEGAVDASDADYDALTKARGGKSSHVALGKDAELEWEDAMLRLRHYVAGRAKRHEVEKIDEGRRLLAPLTDAITQMRALAATRATLRSKKAGGSASKSAAGAQDDAASAQEDAASAPESAASAPKSAASAPSSRDGASISA